MMNLELFFVGEEMTGNRVYRQHAISHADKTMQNHVRPDGKYHFAPRFHDILSLSYCVGSSYHLVTYDANNGDVTFQGTVQGYADNRQVTCIVLRRTAYLVYACSTWSRGQAWGIYGFANSNSSMKITSWTIIDLIQQCSSILTIQNTSRPPGAWRITLYKTFLQMESCHGRFSRSPYLNLCKTFHRDFNAPLQPPRPADSSAATIAATGLLLLAQMEMSLSPANTTGRDLWSGAAVKVRRSSLDTMCALDNPLSHI